jgi:putative copper-exporting ATPase
MFNLKGVRDMEKTITVNGMKCEHCKATVEAALKALEGVKSAEVNLAERNVNINFDENVVSEAQMKQAVDAAGHFEMVNE